jgi:hypothetical protein
VLTANVALARRMLKAAVPRIAAHVGPPPMSDALKNAIMTHPSVIDPQRKRELEPLVRKYLG